MVQGVSKSPERCPSGRIRYLFFLGSPRLRAGPLPGMCAGFSGLSTVFFAELPPGDPAPILRAFWHQVPQGRPFIARLFGLAPDASADDPDTPLYQPIANRSLDERRNGLRVSTL